MRGSVNLLYERFREFTLWEVPWIYFIRGSVKIRYERFREFTLLEVLWRYDMRGSVPWIYFMRGSVNLRYCKRFRYERFEANNFGNVFIIVQYLYLLIYVFMLLNDAQWHFSLFHIADFCDKNVLELRYLLYFIICFIF